MEFMQIEHLKDKRITQLSGGEKQRVIIARAIAQECNVMLLDEPTSSLDIYHEIEVLKYIKKRSNRDTITITVLHDINLAAQYSDFIILLSHGEIATIAPVEEVVTSDNIEKIYNVKVDIYINPTTGKPYIISKGE